MKKVVGTHTGTARLALLLLLLSCGLWGGLPPQQQSAQAETRRTNAPAPPQPLSRAQSLEKVETELEKEKQSERQTKKQLQALRTEVGKQEKQLLALSKEISANESNLSLIESRMADLGAQKEMLEEKFTHDKAALSQLVLALQRLSRVPPEALMIRPGAPLQTAQSALLLQGALPALQGRAQRLRTDLTHLRSVLDRLAQDKDTAEQLFATLQDRYQEMESLLKRRQQKYQRTDSAYKRQRARLNELSTQAGTLRELVAKIEEDKKREQARLATRNAVLNRREPPLAARSAPLPWRGKALRPVSGRLRNSYGQRDFIGATNVGLSFESRPRALVISPIDGVAVYTGPFKNYGNIVILEHGGKYHSLIAGLNKIDTVVGQSLKAGEPVGRMGAGETGGANPVLYYELRHKGQPVDPSGIFAGIGRS